VKVIAFIFLSLAAFFTLQPLIGSQRASPVPSACCSKGMMKCPKKSPPASDNKKCRREGCNPFMACAYGNFYMAEKGGIGFLSITPEKKKKMAINDNRLSTNLSESWHPPECISDLC